MGIAVGLAVTLFLVNPAAALTAIERFTLPFGGIDWPRQTKILDVEYKERVARGEPYSIRARIAGVVPEYASVVFEGIVPARQTFALKSPPQGAAKAGDASANAGEGNLNARLDRVEHNFRFRIEANDAATGWYEVAVQPPPVLVPLNGRASPQLSLRFPTYTDLPPLELPDGNGSIDAVVGTRVTLKAAVDRPVARAWIEYHPDQPLARVGAFTGLLGARDGTGLITQTVAYNRVAENIPVHIEGGRILSVDFVPVVRGMYGLHFEDETGLGNTRLFDLRLQPDPAPTVTLERPSPARDNLSVLADAEITLRLTAQDPQFAIRSTFLSYRIKRAGMDLQFAGPSGERSVEHRVPLYDHAGTGAALPHFMRLSAAPLNLPARPFRLRPTQIRNSGRLALAELAPPAGLFVGDVIALQACADDFDDVSVFKEPGRSAEIELHIVSRQVLDDILNRAQTQVQEELLRLRKEQQEASDRVVGPKIRWEKTGKLRPQEVDQLLQAEQMQQQIRARVGDKEEGLRGEVSRILQSLKDNHLPRAGVHERMETVAQELDRAKREHLEQIEPNLTNARKENETSTGKPPAPDEKTELGEARRHQEEVERAFSELLKMLEPWGNISSVKGEAKALLDEQRRLQRELDKLNQDDNLGKSPDALTPEQKAALDRVAELQRKLQERTGQLMDKISRAAEDRKTKDPEVAGALKDALEKGQNDGIQGKMKEASENVRDNKLGKAAENQEGAAKGLENMVKAMDERRVDQLDTLRKKLEKHEDELVKLAEEQDRLRKQAKEARQIADPKQREQELKRLADEQEKLAKKAKALENKLKELRADRPAQSLGGAARNMEQAGKKLRQGEDDVDDRQEEALNRLNEAQRRLNQDQDRVDEELEREKLAKVADQIKGFKERQEGHLNEGERLRQKALLKKKWERTGLTSLGRLAEAQQSLSEEVDKVAKNDLKNAKVFSNILSRSAEAMKQAAEQMRKVQQAQQVSDAEAGRLQRDALRRLDQLLDALKKEKNQAAGKPQEGGDQGGGGAGGGPRPPQDGIPQLAELKALRALQKEVNDHTESFSRDHPDPKKLTPGEQRELQNIKKDQAEVANLLEELTAPEPGEGDNKK
jgi:hypothetical protein